MKKLILLGLAVLSGVGVAFAASTIWSTMDISMKNIADGVSHGEFNTLIQTTKGIYHDDGGTLDIFTDDKFGFGVTDPQAAFSVSGVLKVGNTAVACSELIEGGVRFNDTSLQIEFCDGTSWRSFLTCEPQTCASQGFTCGSQSDGCDGILDCGTCASGSICSNGSCAEVACSSSAECNDGELCTTDTCISPGTAEAMCSNASNSATQVCTATLGTCTNTGVRVCSGGSLSAVCSASTPVPSTWGPATSTECSGVSFIQTSNCGTTRSALGTKTCAIVYSPVTDLVGNKIWHLSWQGQWVYAKGYCIYVQGKSNYTTFTTATTSGKVCRCDSAFNCSGESCTTGKAYYTSITCQ